MRRSCGGRMTLNPAMESPRKTRKGTEEENWEKQGIHHLGQRRDGCIRFPFRAFGVFRGLSIAGFRIRGCQGRVFAMCAVVIHSFLRRFLAALLPVILWAASALSAVAGSEVRPPFGLAWGLEFQPVEEAILAAGGHVAEKLPGGAGGERWSVEGIPQDGLQRAVFTFAGGRLAGVELQYSEDGWDAQTYDEFMRRVTARLDREHGTGRLLIRQRTPVEGVMKTVVGYSWAGGAQSVSLIYFAAQDERHLFRVVSLHYSSKPARARL